MFIYYGTRVAHIKTAHIDTVTCSNCETNGPIQLDLFSWHFHLFFLPIFPYRKRGIAQCENCGHETAASMMQTGLKQEYLDFKRGKQAPIWQFSGLILIVLLITAVTVSNRQDNKKEREYMANPVEGDIYEYETDDGNYSTFKVLAVSGDTVKYLFNTYWINQKSGISDIDIEENYSDTIYYFLQTELAYMYEEGVIYDVRRD